MIHFDAWKRMSPVERRNYEANVAQSKRIQSWGTPFMIVILLVTGALLWLHSEGAIS